MIEVMLSCALIAQAQQNITGTEVRAPTTWTEFYLDAAKQYKVTRLSGRAVVPVNPPAVFDWTSIDDFHGAVFAWTDNGRPTMLATIFSFPLKNSNERLAVHEFASFTEADVVVDGPGGIQWKPAPVNKLQRIPDGLPPPDNPNMLKLHCRRLAKEFSASMNRRDERWDLRLLPTPLVEYQEPSEGILGGGLFAFVGYSTDPEILLLLEARKSEGGPAWHFLPVRFSDKSLHLKFKDKLVWESLRTGHGASGPDTDDPQYRVLTSVRLSPQVVKQLSAAKANK